MTSDGTTGSTNPSRPLRVWPGAGAAVLLLAARFGVKEVVPGVQAYFAGVMATFALCAVILLWWLFASRAPWGERFTALGLMIGALGLTWAIGHESMGLAWALTYALPLLFVALALWALLTRNRTSAGRRRPLVATMLVATLPWALARHDGISGDHDVDFNWRWRQTSEDLLRDASEGSGGEIASLTTAAAWPGFRGPRRDGRVSGARVATDWETTPPVELWRRPVGPAWSSFAVSGDVFYTQEQRDDDEIVSCYRLSTGEPIWIHRDRTRFFEAQGGAGPRATPTLDGRRLYTLGATGILNALDAASGEVIWSRHVGTDSETAVPDWGFSASPLLAGDLVIVAAAGRLMAYDRATGAPRWSGEPDPSGYSSPHPIEVGGVPQVVLTHGKGATAVDPASGEPLWHFEWSGFPIVQPAEIAPGEVLVTASSDGGIRRLAVSGGPGAWSVEERWISRSLKPYFNDLVVHRGDAYGFDARILASVDLETGERNWKGGRYGNGQLILLPDQDLLLVLSERGDLALVSATPERFTELARRPALEGKTWNHPVLVDGTLLVRNSEEMAAFHLPPPAG